ncbi:MAG: trigger factor [Lachnospiraceae bacterium]|nr:trigger factor [Lachnospiraceae bacterium]
MMKKKMTLFAMAVMLTGMLSACGKDAAYVRDIKASDYVTLGEYTGIEVTVDDPATTAEAKAQEHMDYLASICAEAVEVTDRDVVQTGDTVNIDYAGYQDGVAFENGTAAGADLTIGSGAFIPGFEDGLIGKKVGEDVTLDLTFPDDYKAPEMAGVAVTFEVKINSISIMEPCELNIEFIQEVTNTDYATIEEYREFIYGRYYENEVLASENDIAGSIAKAVMDGSTFKQPPEKMIERYRNIQVEDMTTQLAAYNVSLDAYMQTYYGMDKDTYMEQFTQDATTIAKQYIMFQAIADAEGLNPSEEEFNQSLEAHVADSGYESMDAFKEEIGEEVYYEYLMSETVMDFLKEKAVVSYGTAE